MTEQFTDEEHAFLRHVRFGELPGRILPEDMVESQETEPQRQQLPDAVNEYWYLRYSAG
jgi:hypothetical protein